MQQFGGFCHQLKVRQAIGRLDSIQAVCQRMKRLETFWYLAAHNFDLFSKIKRKMK
jgi:hypothetical protein